ncbi:MAG TPA: RNA polymerase sigma-70 factor [Puia sp.]|nr:RNA polymerase sigma-70 factor [Puia sp.]
MTFKIQNEKLLLRQVARHDEKAFKALFEAYQPRLYHYIIGIVKSKETAEEMVIDVFLKIWQQREMMGGVERLDAFLFRIAFNHSVDFLRRAARDPKIKDIMWQDIELAGGMTSDEPVLVKEYEVKLKEAIGLLSPQRQLIFRMSREKNFSHSDIAEKLRLSKYTVSNHISESLRFIRAYLANFLTILLLFFW